MSFIIVTELILFALVFYKLVTTNHWSIGKKLLVALTAGLMVESGGLLLAIALKLPVLTISIIKIPKMVIALIMTYYFYRHDSVFEH